MSFKYSNVDLNFVFYAPNRSIDGKFCTDIWKIFSIKLISENYWILMNLQSAINPLVKIDEAIIFSYVKSNQVHPNRTQQKFMTQIIGCVIY